MISHAATIPDDGPKRTFMINDVRRAYFYAKIQGDVYIGVPEEDDKRGTGMLGHFRLCLYGTRDAAKGWQETLSAIIEQLGLEGEMGVVTPGAPGAAEEDVDDDTPLSGQAVTQYRGVIARCNYMGTDRPDCLFAIKEGCRKMSAPTIGSLRRLLRIG